MRAAAWLVIGVDLAEDLDMGEPFNGGVAHIGNSRKVSEVIGPPAPQIVPKKHVALAC